MKKTRRQMTRSEVNAIRAEYINDPDATFEYLADKYDRAFETIYRIIHNLSHHDPIYKRPTKEASKTKKKVYLPPHILEIKDGFTPAPTTTHRARGHNYTINKFS